MRRGEERRVRGTVRRGGSPGKVTSGMPSSSVCRCRARRLAASLALSRLGALGFPGLSAASLRDIGLKKESKVSLESMPCTQGNESSRIGDGRALISGGQGCVNGGHRTLHLCSHPLWRSSQDSRRLRSRLCPLEAVPLAADAPRPEGEPHLDQRAPSESRTEARAP